MSFRKNILVNQKFKANKFLKIFKRIFPKFKGYWLPLKYLFKIVPSKLEVLVSIENLNFRVPLDLEDSYQLDIYFRNKEELLEPYIISKLLNEKGVFFDVGANCGWYTRIVSILRPQSLIFAFEPNRVPFKFLSQFCSSNILTLPAAVGEASEDKVSINNPFYRQPSGSSIKKSKDGISIISLDKLSKRLNLKPQFVKIDVEGYEMKVLDGAIETLKIVDYVLIEVNDSVTVKNCSYEINSVYEIMKKSGFLFAYDIQNGKNEISEVLENKIGAILFSRINLKDIL